MLPPRRFADDFAWQDARLWLVKQALGKFLVAKAPMDQDRSFGTDLVVLMRGELRIAVRLRQERYFARYADEFTIRNGRPSGVRTELHKIRDGLVDYFFYGFPSEDGQELTAWFLGDLAVFRRWYDAEVAAHRDGWTPGTERMNPDGTTFLVFALDQLPPGFRMADCVARGPKATGGPRPPRPRSARLAGVRFGPRPSLPRRRGLVSRRPGFAAAAAATRRACLRRMAAAPIDPPPDRAPVGWRPTPPARPRSVVLGPVFGPPQPTTPGGVPTGAPPPPAAGGVPSLRERLRARRAREATP